MRRVVITGVGIISSIGNSAQEVTASLRESKSGISFAPDYAEHGFRCQVHGAPQIDLAEQIDKRQLRFMGDGAAYNFLAMQQAIADAGLEDSDVSNERTGLVMGSGGPSTKNLFSAHQTVIEKGAPKRMGPFMVTRCMSSTNSACLATPFKIKGVNYSITSACSTSAHCIGNGVEQIQWGKQDIVFAGGGEELDWTLSCLFDAMGAMSSKYNDSPKTASRAFDTTRDGFVIAGGAGVVVLEELEHARARGAKIYGEWLGYGLSGDAYHITSPAPDGDGGYRSMKAALDSAGLDAGALDYVNAHGTSTPVGDEIELRAVEKLLDGKNSGLTMSSTKSSTGHLLGAAGAIEAIFSILALRDQMVPPTLNLHEPSMETAIDLAPLEKREREVKVALSNSFGFGGTNASLLFGQAP